jgi:hypothetical protein
MRSVGIKFRTGHARRSWAFSPWQYGLERQAARSRAATSPSTRPDPNAGLRRSREAYAEAHAWALLVGFSVTTAPAAAMAAMMLRSTRGPGKVTAAMVRERMEARR